MIHPDLYNSTYSLNRVVQFSLFLMYNDHGKIKKEVHKMNTDKIYAESIAKEYAPKDNSKIVALRKLDAKAKNPANIFAYTFGIISALVLGTGMSLAM